MEVELDKLGVVYDETLVGVEDGVVTEDVVVVLR
jgi:hypothetical protein